MTAATEPICLSPKLVRDETPPLTRRYNPAANEVLGCTLAKPFRLTPHRKRGRPMATRKSFHNALRIFLEPVRPHEPVALLTAWRDNFDVATNKLANGKLIQRLNSYHLSWVPVVGCWTDTSKGRTACELSFLIRPKPFRKHPLTNEHFLDIVRDLLFNPANETISTGTPPNHCQEAAIVKVPKACWSDPHFATLTFFEPPQQNLWVHSGSGSRPRT